MRFNLKIDILKAVYVTVIILSNLLGAKVITLFYVPLSVGIFMVPVAFLITDIIEDVRGKRDVHQLILVTVIALLITFLYTALSVILAPADRYIFNEEYTIIYGNSLRMIIASLIAFILAQLHDVFTFEKVKKLTKGKYIWMRNNISTFLSQIIDTTVFMFIAFYQVTPKFDVPYIISMIIPYFAFKVIFAFIDTPLCYLGIFWLKKSPDYVEKRAS